MAVAARFHKENPWERIRLMAQAMPRTPLSYLTTGMRFISWERASDEFMALTFRLLVRAGIRRFLAMDPSNDARATLKLARTISGEGGRNIVAALVYTISPQSDDAYYAERAALFAQSPLIDRVYIKDPGGLLTPERARTLISAVRARPGRETARAAFALHDRARSVLVRRRRRSRRGRAAHGRGTARKRHVAADGRARSPRICGSSVIRSKSTMRRSRT